MAPEKEGKFAETRRPAEEKIPFIKDLWGGPGPRTKIWLILGK